MAVDEKILQKIQNLFNLAKDNPNDNEAQTALLMAQKIMAKHGIEQAEVDCFGTIKPKEVVEEDVSNVNKLMWWEKQLAMVVAKNFRCEVFTRGSSIIFLGLKDDVQLGKMVYNFAVNALQYNTETFVRRYKRHNLDYSVGVKNDFITGWIKGLNSKYEEQVKENDWGLVLVKDPLVDEAINKYHLRKGKSSQITRGRNNGAYSKGYAQGREFSSPSGVLK